MSIIEVAGTLAIGLFTTIAWTIAFYSTSQAGARYGKEKRTGHTILMLITLILLMLIISWVVGTGMLNVIPI